MKQHLVSSLGWGRIRYWVPDLTPIHNLYTCYSGQVPAWDWSGIGLGAGYMYILYLINVQLLLSIKKSEWIRLGASPPHCAALQGNDKNGNPPHSCPRQMERGCTLPASIRVQNEVPVQTSQKQTGRGWTLPIHIKTSQKQMGRVPPLPIRVQTKNNREELNPPLMGHLERTWWGAYPLIILQFC